MPLSQKEIDQRSGHAATFWKNVWRRSDGKWIWQGRTNTNHNTVDCEKYEYGEYELCSKETSNLAKPVRTHKSKMAHRIVLFLTYGREVPSSYDVFPANGDHLDINPNNLWLRDRKTRHEVAADVFFRAANDNGENSARMAA